MVDSRCLICVLNRSGPCRSVDDPQFKSPQSRAGDGNRTHVASLEGWGSTIELHPRTFFDFSRLSVEQRKRVRSLEYRNTENQKWNNGQRGIRTPVGLSPSDLQSDAIGRSAICPSMLISSYAPGNGLPRRGRHSTDHSFGRWAFLLTAFPRQGS